MNSAPDAAAPPTAVLRAAWVAPMDRPPLRDAAVAFTLGRVVAVGDAKAILAAHPGAPVHDLGASVLLPGLVNAHVHLELSDQRPGPRPARFVDWLLRVMAGAAPPGEAGASG